MAKGIKTGGRKAGTPNKRTKAVAERLDALGCDPIAGMYEIAEKAKKEGNLALAGSMYKELASYMYPKRKAVDVSHSDDKTTVFHVVTGIDRN